MRSGNGGQKKKNGRSGARAQEEPIAPAGPKTAVGAIAPRGELLILRVTAASLLKNIPGMCDKRVKIKHSSRELVRSKNIYLS